MARMKRKVDLAGQPTRLAEEEILPLWKSYREKPTVEARNKLAEHFLSIVKFTAERLYTRLPDEVDINDLHQDGFQGLLDAIESFDLNRGVKFETYCALRVKGAILDSLRANDWVPRLVRARAHKMNEARATLELQLSRAPTDRELADHFAMSTEDYERMTRDSNATGVVSLSRKCYETDTNKDVREIDIVEDKRGDDPLRAVQRGDLKKLLIKGLSKNERLIILLYYYQEMTMKEIGATLDLSESRVSQMHSAILARLRDLLVQRHREFSA
jgi:RNA polymerase sigma factor FliA